MRARLGFGLAGVIAGAVLSALLLKAVESRRADPEAGSSGPGDVASGSPGSAEVEKLRKDLAAARKESESLRDEVDTLRKAVAEASREAEGEPAGSAASKPKSWREIAGRLWAIRDRVKGKKWDDWPDDCKDLQMEMFAAVTDLSRRMGMPIDDVLMSPDGLSRLLVELLGQADPPPTEAERARLEELVAATEGPWKEYQAARAELSKLELRLFRAETSKRTLGAVVAGLTPEQAEVARAFEIFENQEDGGPSKWIEGSREKVVADLSSDWVKTLSLDPIQQTAIRPVVEEFIERATELNNSIWKKKQEGEDIPWAVQWRAQAELMIATQKRLAETAHLTEEQAKAMKEWGEVYGVNVYQPPPPPPEK